MKLISIPFLSTALVFSGSTNPTHPDTIGCIDSMCDVPEVVRGQSLSARCQLLTFNVARTATLNSLFFSLDAYESAKLMCEQYYLGAPELELRQMNGEKHRHPYWLVALCESKSLTSFSSP